MIHDWASLPFYYTFGNFFLLKREIIDNKVLCGNQNTNFNTKIHPINFDDRDRNRILIELNEEV